MQLRAGAALLCAALVVTLAAPAAAQGCRFGKNGCSSCTLTLPFRCTACYRSPQAGYFGLNSTTGTCVRCPKNCFSCNGQGVCSQCLSFPERDEFYGLNARTGQCVKCPAKCGACSVSRAGRVRCSRCLGPSAEEQALFLGSGTVLNKTSGECLTCPPSCKRCQLVGGRVKCVECYQLAPEKNRGLVLNTATGQCTKCPALCRSCSAPAKGRTRCLATQCTLGEAAAFNNKTGQCVECGVRVDSAPCKACNAAAPSLCTACYPGAKLFKKTGACVRCPESCSDCTLNERTGITRCSDACADGSVYDATSGKCATCPGLCLACEISKNKDNSQAVVCLPGGCSDGSVFDKGTSLCKPCPSFCTKCELDSKGSTRCLRGQCIAQNPATVSNPTTGQCEQCPVGCKKCVLRADGRGTRCLPGQCQAGIEFFPRVTVYNPSTGLCDPCPPACLECKLITSGPLKGQTNCTVATL